MIKSTFKRFFALEAASGIVLLLVTMAAIVCENSGLRDAYQFLMHLPIRLGVGDLALEKSLSHWVNDGLMVIFFFLVGMEIKREAISGHLASRQQALLPFVSALGGMIVPAMIFWMFDHPDPMAIRGWAIPTATDIAFALPVGAEDRVMVGAPFTLIFSKLHPDQGWPAVDPQRRAFHLNVIDFLRHLLHAWA